ncbi:hypothetical protein ACJIZ3_015485 [Penstemon smallii]|uniref:TF-B3 domain-containing protein n=1 Tax=Penstemon smallii TaxID=265156 RepID=A0ABD3RMM7_9LAMI
MEEKRKDRLVAYHLGRNPNLTISKRKRRKPYKKTMKELMEIKETYTPNRDLHEKPNETGIYKRKRAVMSDFCSQVEIISSDLERAQEVQENLNTQFPSFVKTMIRSNVTHGFWLSLPKLFCDLYLPTCDVKVTLVDESRKEYYTKYLADRRGLSAGWRGFSIAHNLEEGDVLVFHLIEACKMKVYIVRAHRFGAVDAALSLLHLQAHAELVNNGEHLKQHDGDIPLVIEKILSPLSQGMPHDNFEKVVRSSKSRLVTDHTQNFSNDLAMALEDHYRSDPRTVGSICLPCS